MPAMNGVISDVSVDVRELRAERDPDRELG